MEAKATISVGLKLKSGALLSALCASCLSKLVLDLRAGWDSVEVFKVGAEREGKETIFQMSSPSLRFCGKQQAKSFDLLVSHMGEECCLLQVLPFCCPLEELGVLSSPLSRG